MGVLELIKAAGVSIEGRDVVMPRWYGNYSGPAGRPTAAGPGGQLGMPGGELAQNNVKTVEG